MTRATNYTTGRNRAAKARTEKWLVRLRYTDARIDCEYPFRTEIGARKAYSHYLGLIPASASDPVPMIGVEIIKIRQAS